MRVDTTQERREPLVERIEELSRTVMGSAGVDGCGVSVLSAEGTQVTVCVTDKASARVEELQQTLGEGPCFDAATTGSPVLLDDMTDVGQGVGTRWPVFHEQLLEVGVHALFAFPIRIGAISLGTIDLYRRSPGPLSPEQLTSALLGVDALGAALLDVDSWGAREDRGLTHSMLVHQAAGMVMVQLDARIDVALVRLRATAFAEGRSVDAMAADVVSGRRRLTEESS
jgi:hypothetical protein